MSNAARLFAEVQGYVDLIKDFLIDNNTTLDKFCSQKIEIVTSHWLRKNKKSGV